MGVSAATGLGINDLLNAIDEAAEEYERNIVLTDRAIAERKKLQSHSPSRAPAVMSFLLPPQTPLLSGWCF